MVGWEYVQYRPAPKEETVGYTGDVRRGSGEETALGEADGVRSFWMNWGRGVLYRQQGSSWAQEVGCGWGSCGVFHSSGCWTKVPQMRGL